MAAQGSQIYVIVIFVLSLVFTFVAAGHLYFTMTNPKASGRNNRWLSSIMTLLIFFMLYPYVFLAIDILDAQLCTMPELLLLHTGGISTGCYIPIQAMWDIIGSFNFASCFLIIPFLRFLRSNHQRRRIYRILIAAAAALGCFGSFRVTTAVIAALPNSILREPIQTTVVVPDCFCQSIDWQSVTECDCYLPPHSCIDFPTAKNQTIRDATEPPACNGDTDSMLDFLKSDSSFYAFSVLSTQQIWTAAAYIVCLPMLSVGLIIHPWSLIRSFMNRPRVPISKAEFITCARSLYASTKHVQRKLALWAEVGTKDLGWLEWVQVKWQLHKLSREMTHLELLSGVVESQAPKGADPELTWTLRLLWIWLKLIYGLAAAVSSILWIANAMLFLEPNPPVFYVFNYLIAFYPFGDKNLWHHILNVIDLVFLLFMILHLFLCTLHGALYFRDRIIIFRSAALAPRILTVVGAMDVFWPLVFCEPAITGFATHNLRSAVAGTKALDAIAFSEALGWEIFSSVNTGNSFFGIFLIVCLALAAVAIPVLEIWFPRAHTRRGALVSLLSHQDRQ